MEKVAMKTRGRESNAAWNRRRERDYEWQRAKRDLCKLVLFVVLSFVLGMFIKNINPVAVLGEWLKSLFVSWGIGQ